MNPYMLSDSLMPRGLSQMNMEKLTTKFQEALAQAQSLAVGRDHRFIEPAHVLLAMFNQK